MAPIAMHIRSLAKRETEYAFAPFWIVLLVLLGAGFAVLSAYAIGRHFFPPAAEQTTIGQDENGMTQTQYQRQIRIRTQEQLQATYGFRGIPRPSVGYHSNRESGNGSMVSY
ncbi:uncharacterized protein RCC_09533 [Ramularia collo-cygni]|uniref:Uncharacterized protein n=1 Tax=Ramularia collo-cygni TaxID=112498 RepID=A0A2D3VKA5_9PEZI|nr:uncharacterized protein RCC_09533 [Ramularia collo-cygni]CZT23819.1 uncharacterized protein RCC_09533 [Ramularia collo-cygni]